MFFPENPNLGLVFELEPFYFNITYSRSVGGDLLPVSSIVQQTANASVITIGGATSGTITGYFSDVFFNELHYQVPNEPSRIADSFETITSSAIQYTYWYDQTPPFIQRFYFTVTANTFQAVYYLDVRRNHTIARDLIEKNMNPISWERANAAITWINSSSQTVTWITSDNKPIPWRRGS